ncbi:MAG TPA: uracil-DNA glycosylase [Bacteroidales bacterium]|nr:uracil-DNA glycosylase [Bacteroidales bacterium]
MDILLPDDSVFPDKTPAPVRPVIEESWHNALRHEFNAPYFAELKKFLVDEKKKHIVFPPGNLIFNAFNLTPLQKVKVVILGQDPYHGPGQAHGLCFSVPNGVALPPSLRNIYTELKNDLQLRIPSHGYLEKWAKEGVLLLNATLTVRMSQAGSHQGKGWERFTDAAIKAVSNERQGVVFLLWGNYAIAKEALIDTSKHLVLKAPHPSPLSASRGFLGCRHFSKTNNYLLQNGNQAVDWQIE